MLPLRTGPQETGHRTIRVGPQRNKQKQTGLIEKLKVQSGDKDVYSVCLSVCVCVFDEGVLPPLKSHPVRALVLTAGSEWILSSGCSSVASKQTRLHSACFKSTLK